MDERQPATKSSPYRSWPRYEAADTGIPSLLVSGPGVAAAEEAAEGGQGAGRKDRADARRRQGARAERPLPASRRSVVGRPAGVSRNDLLHLSRLDLQARHRRARRGVDRRSRLADLRQGRRSRQNLSGRRARRKSSGSMSATSRIRRSKRISPKSSWSRTPSSFR